MQLVMQAPEPISTDTNLKEYGGFHLFDGYLVMVMPRILGFPLTVQVRHLIFWGPM